MVQYYTLQEAAARLNLSPEQLKEMAKKNEIRAFQDRGNLRFRAQEIDELARNRGLGSDVELPLGEGDAAKASEPKSGSKSPAPKSSKLSKAPMPPSDEEFSLNLGANPDEVPIGQDPASASKNTPRNTNTRSPGAKKRSGLNSPSPKPGSDSDVRLVGDGGALEFQIDSEVKVEKSPAPGPKSSGSGKKSKVDPGPDSGVRIVPLDESSDSDVKIVPDDPDSNVPLGGAKSKTPSDSDIRLEELQADSGKSRREDKGQVTEEIDLDLEELKAAQESAKRKTSAKPKPGNVGSSAQLPTVSPFELSEPDIGLGPKSGSKKGAKSGSSKVDPKKASPEEDSSSDFELKPIQDLGSSPLELGSDEHTPIRLDDSDEEEVGLGELTGPSGGKSGINLQDPVDSGISLESGGSDEMEIELNLDAGATPKPSQKIDSSSEFELSLDDSDSSSEEEEEASSSEFELTLDEGSSPAEEATSSEFELSLDLESSSQEIETTGGESDSEFELTIDDSGGMLPIEEEAALEEEEDKDIFETDFEVPALDDESGSEAVALDEGDTDLESSDFDLAVDEENETEAESGSEVVALDEEEAAEVAEDDRPAAKRKKPGSRTAVLDDDEEAADFGDLEADIEEEGEAEEEEETATVAAAPAEWGIIPALFMTPCAFIMVIVCLMSFEMISGMFGYHRSTKTSSLIVDPLARMVYGDESFPKE